MTSELILIVEDEPDLLALFKTMLQRRARQATILTAHGGQAAIRLLSEQTPSIVVLDLAMPHVSGNDVLRFMVTQPHLQETKVILVTAVPTRLAEDVAACVSLTLIKPVSPGELETAVLQMLGMDDPASDGLDGLS